MCLGATYTSKAVIAAVSRRFRKPKGLKTACILEVLEGFGGTLTVEVTVAQGSITKVAVLDNSETPFIAESAIKELREPLPANQSWEVDVVSGATVTSKAIMAAVEAALTN